MGVLDHANGLRVATLVGAIEAGVGVGDVRADRAVGDPLLDVTHRVDERVDVVPRLPEQVEGETLGALGSDAGQLLELLDEPDERRDLRHPVSP